MKQNANTLAATTTITPPTTPPATAPADMVDRFCDEASIAEPGLEVEEVCALEPEGEEVCALEPEGEDDDVGEPEVGPLEVTAFPDAEILDVIVGGWMGGGIGADTVCVGAVTVIVGALVSSSKVYMI